MKKILPLLCIISSSSYAQVTIETDNLPQPNDVLITQPATLLTEVDLEQSGENQTWYFGEEMLQSMLQNTTLNCVDVDDTPIAYQFLFNNPFDPEHNSDFAQGIESFEVGTITFEDAYQYFQNNAQHYAMTGMGVSITGLPLAAVANDVDMIYQLPLNYADTDTSETEMQFDIPTIGFWGLEQTRTYEVDGWGTLIIHDMSFDVIRYRAVINATDSLYSEAFGFGFNLPRPEAIEYKWLSPDYNVPVLQINTSGGFVTAVATAAIFEVGVKEIAETNISLYPNPASSQLNFSNVKCTSNVLITDAAGKTVMQFQLFANAEVDITSLAPGLYQAVLCTNDDIATARFVKE